MSFMSIVCDVLVVAVVFICVIIGGKRGFVRTVSKGVALIAAIAIAMLITPKLSDRIYDSWVAPGVQDTVTQEINKAGSSIQNGLNSAYEKLPGFIHAALENANVKKLKNTSSSTAPE